MQADRAEQLRDEWALTGGSVCPHPQLAKEYILGSNTGDKVCTTCGDDFSPGEMQEMGR